MRVCLAGDCHGRIRAMYDNIEAMRSASAPWDLVIQVGDFGVWPDRKRIDRTTRDHGEVGDFAELQAAGKSAPVPTVFIAGNDTPERMESKDGQGGTQAPSPHSAEAAKPGISPDTGRM